MAFYPVANTVELTFVGNFRGQLAENTMWFEKLSGGIALTDVQNLASAAIALYATGFAPILSNDWELERVIARDYSAVESYIVDDASTTATGSGGDAMPNNVTICASFRTGFPGRSFRGRNYVPAIPRASVVENEVDSTFSAAVIAAYGSFLGVGTVQPDWTWVIVNRRTGGAWLPAGITHAVTSIILVDRVIDSQRRRLPGRGR